MNRINNFPLASNGGGLRERKKSARRARISAAASEVFRQKGYDEATLREIAARADVAIGTIFSYVRDKRELLLMVVNDELGAVAAEAFSSLPGRASFLQQLLYIFKARFEFWARDPELARHALHETAGHPSDVEGGRFEAARATFLEQVSEIVRKNQAKQRIDPKVDAVLIARVMIDIYIGENRRWLATGNPLVPDGMRNLESALALAIKAVAVRKKIPEQM